MKIGIDSIEIKRFNKPEPRLVQRILHASEYLMYQKMSFERQNIFLAGRFALKEAIYKASSIKLNFKDLNIQIENEQLVVYYQNKLQPNTKISLTHTKDIAMAICIINE